MSQIYDDFTWNFSQCYDFKVSSPQQEDTYINPLNVIEFYDARLAKSYAKSKKWVGEITCPAKILSFLRFDKRRYFPPMKITFTPQ